MNRTDQITTRGSKKGKRKRKRKWKGSKRGDYHNLVDAINDTSQLNDFAMSTMTTQQTMQKVEEIRGILEHWYTKDYIQNTTDARNDIIACTHAYWKLVQLAKREDLLYYPYNMQSHQRAPYISRPRPAPETVSLHSWGTFAGPLRVLRQWFICLNDKLAFWKYYADGIPEVAIVTDDIRERLTSRRTTRQSHQEYDPQS